MTAYAYTHSGSKWSDTTEYVTIMDTVTGNYHTAIGQAMSNISSATPAKTLRAATGYTWTANVSNYGNTGWEGQSEWSYNIWGKTNLATSKVNSYYIGPSSPIAQIRVLWLHELSHVWGLGHSGSNTVMYESATGAYRNGVRYLTADDINGYKSLY